MPTSSSGRARRLSRATAAALLPLTLLAPAVPAAAASRSAPGGGWSGTWLSSGTTGTAGTALRDVRRIIGADSGAAASLTGAGVGVALLDTGVAPVPGIPAAQLVNGPDLSFESQSDELRYLDTYGHGTHLAGIIIGNDTASGSVGLAPKAKLTSVKLGTANGAVDVSQVIAAIDWVVEHRNDDPANPTRVLNLSYGSGGNPAAWTDPLQYAAEQAWKAGIVVVAAAGNDGNGSTTLANPATDPFVLSVGATATNGTTAAGDDTLATYTNLATQEKQPDVLAPGESIASLRDPGSNIDNNYPGARTGTTLFRGSGTSQAAAVTSAAVALLLQARPSLTPDQVKDLLKRGTAVTGKAATLGLKQINVGTALGLTPSSSSQQTWTPSNGSGNLDDARGDSRVVSNNVPLSGEMTIFGPFHSANWAVFSSTGASWQGGQWMGMRMAGDGWTGSSFASRTWAPATWAGTPWGGASSWTDPNWTGRFWSGRFWSAGAWSGRFWSSEDWSGSTWG
ncbi:serine protease AprX [Actinoplanes octamycinicus]|uniref:Serine protease AprX n=1 Tax=Actinoplanes octamycinicus TaxID=135948 RepID=A0A7W7M8X5_9ACTN|nr:S8 family serine peptidase [Actinoplanes octamycinicus]MBB4741423.1 serine protease AprX [Actinoplanes octamycinicus]GIE62780.1 hypothetical protein Aoc01nite_81820 [Actinoplanes octamycinicus]